MTKIETMSEVERHEVSDFFVPGWAEVFLYILLAGVIALVLNAGSIISKLSNNYIGTPDKLKANFSTLSEGFSHSFSSALGGRLGQIILWAFVGSVVYMSIWLARNILNSFENDIISAHYLHPSSYSQASSLGMSLSTKVFLLAEVIITVAYFFISITAALPAVAALAGSAVYNWHPTTSPFYILFAVLGIALVIYIARVLLRLLAHLWKLL